MTYKHTAIPETSVPRAVVSAYQHALDTYASETSKTASIWEAFGDADLDWRPHPRSSTVREIFRHQLLSERRFFAEFMLVTEPAPEAVLPAEDRVAAYTDRLISLARARLPFLATQDADWWMAREPFFDVERERIWIFWRRVLHSAHHRTQLAVYLRLMDRPVPPTYGPTADMSWQGADPTATVEAAGRK